MQDVISALGGFRGVRAELLVALKKAQPLTAHELGEQFGLTANGLRRYLKALEEDGLVRYERAVHGVGAPVFAYSLAPAGEALFPRSYVSVLATALDALRAEQGTAAVAGVFAGLTVQLRPTLGVELLLPLFAAVILGGVGSIWGAVLGGLIVGLAESASVTLVGAEYRSAAAFTVLIAILMVRPKGLFGEQH